MTWAICPYRPACRGKCQEPPPQVWQQAFQRTYPHLRPTRPLLPNDRAGQ